MKNTIILLVIIVLISSAFGQIPVAGPDNYPQQENTSASEVKSAPSKINILYSLILPGAGQWAMGHKRSAKIFMGTEFVLWAGFLGSHAYSNTIQENYQSYATVHAGVNSVQKDEQYWINIGSSRNIFEFNEGQLRNRNLRGVYTENSLNYWQWDSDDSREVYNDLRVQEHTWEQRATFIVGAFVLNRIVSSVDVIRLIRKEKREIDDQMSSLSFGYKTEKFGTGFFKLNLKVNW